MIELIIFSKEKYPSENIAAFVNIVGMPLLLMPIFRNLRQNDKRSERVSASSLSEFNFSQISVLFIENVT